MGCRGDILGYRDVCGCWRVQVSGLEMDLLHIILQ